MLLFESFKNIESICQKYGISNYTINPDGTVDVDGTVDLEEKRLTKIPLKFGRVTGSFYCGDNDLITLEGSPKWVGDGFYCHMNKLISLEGAPEYVGGDFYCINNKLTSLEGSPKWVGDFSCSDNQLTSLEGGPKKIGGYFNCKNNKLTTLEGGPKEIGGDFYCERNPIYSIYCLFPDYKSYLDSMDYGYLRGRDIVRSRFQEALEEIGVELPESIEGYKYI